MSSATPPGNRPTDDQPIPDASPMLTLVRWYGYAVMALFALLPAGLIAYVEAWQPDNAFFVQHRLHELAILAAVVLGAFVSYVAWRCYRYSGEVFLRWLAAGLVGFTLLYLPHGLFTFAAQAHPVLFLGFGPAARMMMMACLLMAALRYRHAPDPADRRACRPFWVGVLAACLALALAVGLLAVTGTAEGAGVWLVPELIALVLALAALGLQLRRQPGSALMTAYVLALAYLAQSSLAFLLASPWNHTWWLAQGIGLAGFLVLSHGIALAFRTTGSFATVYSQEALMQRLRQANAELQALATTDSLTGARNRREFLRRAAEEIERAGRTGAPLSVLAMDVDRFKDINDIHGHQVGDRVLQHFVRVLDDRIRPTDVIGRVGGEEFLVLLPETNLDEARVTAERMRAAIEARNVDADGHLIRITVSVGVAQYSADGTSLDSWLSTADQRLYLAKRWGRNQVVSLDSPTAGMPPGYPRD